MPLSSLRSVFALVLAALLGGCTSVATYNKKISQPIPVAKLQQDIDYTQRQLVKYYPNLYGYIPKAKLDAKFDSIRNAVNRPMTSNEFYFVISPVIAAVRQGHMSMSPVMKRIDKKTARLYKKRGEGPLSQFVFEWQDEKLHVLKSKNKKNKISEGAEVVSINGITPQSLYGKYRNSFTSDGFNTTFLRKFFSKRAQLYVTNEVGINDSLTYVFRQNDSLITRVVSRNKLKSKGIAKVTDSLTMAKEAKTKDSLIAIARNESDRSKNKAERKRRKIYGYDPANKEYIKSFTICPADSTVAVLKIKNFSQGRYWRIYEKFFDSIKNNNIKTLVIDLRDNPGGRVNEVVELYSYLTDRPFTLLQPATVTSKTSLWKSGVFQSAPLVAYPFIGLAYPFYMGVTYFRTTKNADGDYQYKLTGARERKNNPNHFTGKLYVLINGGSFSASCILSSSLKANPDVTFVGEETGGAFNGTVAGIMPLVQLPNSKIPLRIGLMDIRTINQTKDFEGRGIFPDKEIIPTISDKISKKDPEMDWILQDVKKNNEAEALLGAAR